MSGELGRISTTFESATSTFARAAGMVSEDNFNAVSPSIVAIFVGSEISFPDPIMRSFGAELAHIRALRVRDLKQLHIFAHLHGIPSFTILAQDFAEALSGDEADQLKKLATQSQLILAYDDPIVARETLVRHQADPALPYLGYLPMQRPLPVWLAVSKLLICGENYIPSELYLPVDHAGPSAAPQLNTVAKTSATLDAPPHPLPAPDPEESPLTKREAEVLGLVAQGKQNKMIASEIGISSHTVKLHIHNLIRKLGVLNRTAASAWFLARSPAVPRQNGPDDDDV